MKKLLVREWVYCIDRRVLESVTGTVLTLEEIVNAGFGQDIINIVNQHWQKIVPPPQKKYPVLEAGDRLW